MNNSIFEMFKIDKLGKRIFVRILFIVMVLLNLGLIIYPIGDTNFDAYVSWMNKVMENPSILDNLNLDTVPLTDGNIIFLCTVFIVFMLDLASSWLYTGVFIRAYRKKFEPEKAIKIPKLIFRLFILTISCTFLLSIFSVFVLYLFLFFIIIFPYLVMFPACYLSGDKSFLESFKGMVEVTKGYYMINSRNTSIIVCCYLLFDLIIRALPMNANTSLIPFLNIFILLSLGRYVGIIYLRMLKVPGGMMVIVTHKTDNDVQTPDEKN